MLPPHLADDEKDAREQQKIADTSRIGKQWPSKYGVGGRKAYKSKQRSKRK